MCGVGILSDCDCTKTSFLKSMMNIQYYINPESLIVSGPTNIKLLVGGDSVILGIFDF